MKSLGSCPQRQQMVTIGRSLCKHGRSRNGLRRGSIYSDFDPKISHPVPVLLAHISPYPLQAAACVIATNITTHCFKSSRFISPTHYYLQIHSSLLRPRGGVQVQCI